MSESGEFAVDASVSPVGVLCGESDDQLSDFGFGWWSAPLGGGWLGPVSGDEPAVPPDDRRRFHDEEHLGETPSVERAGEHCEDRAVCFGELRSFDLALEHDELVPQREDLGVALITGGEHPSEARADEFLDRGERVHGSATVSGRCPKPPRIMRPMNFRHDPGRRVEVRPRRSVEPARTVALPDAGDWCRPFRARGSVR